MKDLPALVVLLPLIACAADREPRKKDAGRKVEQAAIDYRGPKVHASIVGSQLAVDIHVHSGGFGLALLRTVAADGHVRVEVVLTAPAEGEIVITAEQTKKLRVALVDGSDPVRIHVRQVQREAHYLVPPALALAAVVTR